MMQNKFDLVMEHIDANIQQEPDEIKKEIYKLTGISSSTFGNCFQVLTGSTLFHYISERKLYFASIELLINKEKSICDIALDYGYSEQSSFTRAMKTFCKCTPNEIRNRKAYIPNNKYKLKDFCDNKNDSRTERIFEQMEKGEWISSFNIELLEGLKDCAEEYGFDFDTCCQIADVADKLDISPFRLLHECHLIVIEEESDPDVLKECDLVAIKCGIDSGVELDEICRYFDCKYYDLDRVMVQIYREEIGK